MPALAHILMHLSLCTAMAHAPSGTHMQVELHAQDRTGRLTFDRQFTLTHEDSRTQTVEFDAPYGTYRVAITAPQYGCSAGDFLVFLPPHSRNIKETLVPGPPRWREQTILLGTAPQSFLYSEPTFVLLDAKTKCGQEIDSTQQSDIDVEYDPDSFYVKVYPMPGQQPNSSLVALQIASSTGDYQYVSLRTTYPEPWAGWPYEYQFNLPQGVFDSLATMHKGVLLCPKLFKTSAG